MQFLPPIDHSYPILPFTAHRFFKIDCRIADVFMLYDFRTLNGNAFSTLRRNLVRFGPVTTEFMTLECVHAYTRARQWKTSLMGNHVWSIELHDYQ